MQRPIAGESLTIILPAKAIFDLHSFIGRKILLKFLITTLLTKIVFLHIQGKAVNCGLFFADPPPPPLGAVSGKMNKIR
jgi:hypothetical protein